ncbi:hypothetical protein EDC32_10149 [Laceyella sacchari]|uniref:hypothetical protein n=1 Tax=Laceyella sacchari TaxID=37482 RepID=UPI0003B44132|nr:hypothetical protein [Laceyella sacchari]TCW40409.1 hypothetical protein EDC32_10149 [Laceyella sacchari]
MGVSGNELFPLIIALGTLLLIPVSLFALVLFIRALLLAIPILKKLNKEMK